MSANEPLTLRSSPPSSTRAAWWRVERRRLDRLMRDGRPRFVYHLATVSRQVRRLQRSLRSVDRLFYSMKANAHPRILQAVAAHGLGVECVSLAEVRYARMVLGPATPLLFTPSFCAIDEFEEALLLGAQVVVDGPEPLRQAPRLFAGREIGLRLDLGRGAGHHPKVVTAGPGSKFGHAVDDLDELAAAVASAGARVVGLSAHAGSGVLDAGLWAATGRGLAALRARFPELRWLDLGGGLGVPERDDQAALDLECMERELAALKANLQDVELRLEPGRFFVSEAGVLLAPVTQVRSKAGVGYVGVATGMNSLIRPALYGAWHRIHNLTRIDEAPVGRWQIVGPICETGDVLGADRPLPRTHPGDLLLIENAGAYGAVLSSSYNLRSPAEECVLDG
jgi:diaminopimelate decarboxylase/aspartate kinase